MKFLISLLLYISFWVSSLYASGSISGFVEDESNGETLIAVNIYLKNTNLGTSSNNSGYYVIPIIPPGDYSLVYSYVGYEDKEVEVAVQENEKLVIDVLLKPRVFEGETITVTAEREQTELKVSNIQVSRIALQRAPQMAEADLMRTLQLLPGVLTLSEFSSGLYIRGGTPDQNLIQLDGTEMYNVNHLFGIFSTFDIDAVKNVELIKGGFPAKYGGRLSSVIDITNMDGNEKEFEGKVAAGLVSTKSSLQGPLWKGSWFFSGRRTYIDYIINAAESSASGEAKEQLEMIPDYYFYDTHLKINQNFDHNNKLALTFYTGKDLLDYEVDPFDFSFQWGNRAYAARFTHIFSHSVFANFNASVSNYNVLVNRDDAFFSAKIENDVNDFTLKADVDYFRSNQHNIKAGFVFKTVDSDFSQRFNNISFLSASGGQQYSLYFQDNLGLMDKLNVQSGLRINFYQPDVFINTYDQVESLRKGRSDVEPRLAVQYRLTPVTTLKASWGIYRQYINIVPFGNADFSFLDVWFPNDNSYKPGMARHYVTGFETRLPFNLKLDTEVYYKSMPYLYEFNPSANEVLKGADLFYAGEGYAYGVDYYLEKSIGKFSGWLSYSLGWTRRKFPELNNGRTYFPKYDRRNSFHLVANYELSRRWLLNFAWSYGTGQAYTQPAAYYLTRWPDQDVSLVLGEAKNSSRLPPYHRMDIGARYERVVKGYRFERWAFYAHIFNLYNRRNIWFRNIEFHEDGTNEEFEVRMLPIVPTFGFEVYF